MPLVTVGATVRRDVNRVQDNALERSSPFGKVQLIASAVRANGTTPAKFHRDTSRVQRWFDVHTLAGKVCPPHLKHYYTPPSLKESDAMASLWVSAVSS